MRLKFGTLINYYQQYADNSIGPKGAPPSPRFSHSCWDNTGITWFPLREVTRENTCYSIRWDFTSRTIIACCRD